MLYLLSLLFPPAAVLLCGKPFQAVLNFFLCLLLWLPGVVHALLITREHHAQRRHEEALAAAVHAQNLAIYNQALQEHYLAQQQAGPAK